MSRYRKWFGLTAIMSWIVMLGAANALPTGKLDNRIGLQFQNVDPTAKQETGHIEFGADSVVFGNVNGSQEAGYNISGPFSISLPEGHEKGVLTFEFAVPLPEDLSLKPTQFPLKLSSDQITVSNSKLELEVGESQRYIHIKPTKIFILSALAWNEGELSDPAVCGCQQILVLHE